MEGIGTGLGQNARVVFVLELKVQKLPCFARKMVFLCFRRLEGWIAHASDSKHYAKVVSNVHKACSY